MNKQRIQPAESTPTEFVTAVDNYIDAVRDHLTGHDGAPDETAVHEARKTLKRLRSLARIVRRSVRKSEYKHANRTFRDAKNALGGLRDAQVRVNTLDEVRKDLGEKATGQATAARKLLRGRLDAVAAEHAKREDGLEPVLEMLEEQRARIRSWDLPNGFEAFEGGIAKTYRDGRDALEDLEKSRSAEDAHELRKRVKDLMYEVEFIEEAHKRPLKALRKELSDLADDLGDDHDLVVLEDSLGKELDVPDLRRALKKRRKALRESALKRARKIYTLKTGEFVDRLREAWEVEEEKAAAQK